MSAWPITALYASPLLRARETAEPCANTLGLPVVLEDGLRELAYGAWEGRLEAEVARAEPQVFSTWVSDPALTAPPGGESAFAVARRAIAVIAAIRARHARGEVLVVSHKATIRIVTSALLGLHVGRFRDRIACPTASLTSFEFGDRGPLLTRVGDTAHLR